MEQHPIPRQITSFEFKLIGFMTLKQFLYVVIFAPLGYIVYSLFPIPFLNIVLGFAVGMLGAVFAFVPVNDRPLEVWIRNFWRRLNSPTQYFYHKNNPPLSIFQNLYFVTDPHRVVAHIESQQKLAQYISATKQVIAINTRKQAVQKTIDIPYEGLRVNPPPAGKPAVKAPVFDTAALSQPVGPAPVQTDEKKPFFIGEVKNNKHISLPGILIYVRDIQGKPVRLLKTNPHGVFATYNPLPQGEYTFEVKDQKNIYFFDTMKIAVTDKNIENIEIISKELL